MFKTTTMVCLILVAQLAAAGAAAAFEPGKYVARVSTDEETLDLVFELRPDGTFSYAESADGREQASYQGTYVSNGPWLALRHAGEQGSTPGPQGLTRTFIVTEGAGSFILAPFDSANVFSFAVLPVARDTAVRYLLTKEGRLATPIGRYELSYELPGGDSRDVELTIKPDGNFVYRESKAGRRSSVMGIRGRWSAADNMLELSEISGRRVSRMEYALKADRLELTLRVGEKPMLAIQPREPDTSVVYQRQDASAPEPSLLNEPHGLYGGWQLQFQNQQYTFTKCSLWLSEPHEFRYTEQVGEEPTSRLELQGTFRLEGDVLVLVLPEKELERSFRYQISNDGRGLLLSMLSEKARFSFPISPVMPGWAAEYKRIVQPQVPVQPKQAGTLNGTNK